MRQFCLDYWWLQRRDPCKNRRLFQVDTCVQKHNTRKVIEDIISDVKF